MPIITSLRLCCWITA